MGPGNALQHKLPCSSSVPLHLRLNLPSSTCTCPAPLTYTCTCLPPIAPALHPSPAPACRGPAVRPRPCGLLPVQPPHPVRLRQRWPGPPREPGQPAGRGCCCGAGRAAGGLWLGPRCLRGASPPAAAGEWAITRTCTSNLPPTLAPPSFWAARNATTLNTRSSVDPCKD